MNFDESVAAHAAWKNKLRAYLRKPDKSLDANVVGSDDQCALGKWLYGEGAKHSAMPEFKELKNLHANFHRAAGDLIRRADAGDSVAEEAALGANSPFSSTSTHVVQLILQLKQKV